MKTPEQDRLLDDVLRNGKLRCFFARSFTERAWLNSAANGGSIAESTPGHRRLRARHPGPVSFINPRTSATTTEAQPAFATIRSTPLSKDRIIKTAALTSNVVTTTSADLQLTFQPTRIEFVRTGDRLESFATNLRRTVCWISFPGRPIALVSRGPGPKRWSSLDSDDQSRFFRSPSNAVNSELRRRV